MIWKSRNEDDNEKIFGGYHWRMMEDKSPVDYSDEESDSGMEECGTSLESNLSHHRHDSPTLSYESDGSKPNIPFRPQIITPSESSAFSRIDRLASSSAPSSSFQPVPFGISSPYGYLPGIFPPIWNGSTGPYSSVTEFPITKSTTTSEEDQQNEQDISSAKIFNEVNTSIPFTNYFQNLTRLLKRSSDGESSREDDDSGTEPGEITHKHQPEHARAYLEKVANDFRREHTEDTTKMESPVKQSVVPSQPIFPNGPMMTMGHLFGPSPFLPSTASQIPQLSPNSHMMQYFGGTPNIPTGLLHPALLHMAGVRGRRINTEKPPPLKKYKCDVCGKAFSRSNTLVTHKRIHTGDKPFKCEVCGRAFRQPGNLTRHRLTHTTVKPYVCPSCNKAFNRASNLHTHMRTHTNFKPFTCPYCGKGFHQKIDMKIHCYTHTGERPHRCDICGKGFTLISTLNAHKRIHNDQQQKPTVA